MDDLLDRLQNWYWSQCDGDWEHQEGVHIETLDNPGWKVSISIRGTNMQAITMPPFEQDVDENNWVFIKIEDGHFVGHGDPGKLKFMLSMFFDLVDGKG